MKTILLRFLRWFIQLVFNTLSGKGVRFDSKQLKRILILLSPSLGDYLINSPVLKAISQNYPSAQITIVLGKGNAELALISGHVHETIVCSEKWFDNEKREGWLVNLLSFYLSPIRRNLLRSQYDLVLNLNGLPESFLLSLMISAHWRVGSHLGRSRNLPDYTGWYNVPINEHTAQNHINHLRGIGISDADPVYHLNVPQQNIKNCRTILQKAEITSHYIILHPGASISSPSKLWFPDRWAQLADHLSPRAAIIWVGTKDNELLIKDIRQKMKADCTCLTELTLLDLAALCQKARLFIGLDTGTTHLAASVGTPTICLMGRLNPVVIGPLGKNAVTIKANNPCKLSTANQCTLLQCSDQKCMAAITELMVYTSAIQYV